MSEQTADLIAFLRARLDEDEAVAREATWGPWIVGPTFGGENNRVYVQPDGPGIDTIGTCVIAGQVSNVPQWRSNAQHIARWDPARALAEVAAKRALLAECEFELARSAPRSNLNDFAWTVLRGLIQPYADHPDYRDEWRPDGI